jgi:hypothetical protein
VGSYELRLARSGKLVLFGSAGWVAYRMSSLHPKSPGTRKNTDKRVFVGKYLLQLEYRVIGAQPRSLLSMARLNIVKPRGLCLKHGANCPDVSAFDPERT